MEKTIGQEIQRLPLRKDPTAVTDYSHIELTEEEAQEALRQARAAKAAKLREQEYWNKVRSERKYPRPNPDELFNIIKRVAFNAIPGYVFDEHNESVLRRLCAYFSGSAEECEKYGISLKKGISLNGPTGCGKTTIMQLFMNNPFQSYALIPSRKVGYDFAEQGFKAIESYSRNFMRTENSYGHEEFGYCFDDLGGTKEERKRFGDGILPMEEVLMNRYDKGKFFQTHITTNLTADQIEEIYGARVRSRMREMFNLIQFDIAAPDRR
ncbi:MAG: ATPase [Bacteroidetes bacterium]|nr:MAG: ATPase [Bacteroidota bacterium]